MTTFQNNLMQKSQAQNWLDAKKEWRIVEYVHCKRTVDLSISGTKTNKVVIIENIFSHERVDTDFADASEFFFADRYEMSLAKVRTDNWTIAFPHDECFHSGSIERIKELLNDKELEILTDIMRRGYRVKGKQVNFMASVYLKCNYNLRMERY